MTLGSAPARHPVEDRQRRRAGGRGPQHLGSEPDRDPAYRREGIQLGLCDAALGADADAKKMAASLTSPQDAAAAIIGGIERGSYRVVIGKDATMLDRLSRLAPQRATDLVAKKMASLLGR